MVIAASRDTRADLDRLLNGIAAEIVPVTVATAKQVGGAYARWGKGLHPAALNYGDCFAYALAKERKLPLLFVGDDFTKTDIASVLTNQK